MAAIIDEYLDTTMEQEDVFPCKGCGEILEEGKAYELAGNRWHLDCFRCNTCHTLLDSDANLLLLGDGSLICSNCTYSCSACGNKIEDLAILTGDQAFCSTCFRCRNCKRKIENLRYARTSLGIFCMGCHETIIAKKRKKSKAAASAKSREKESPMITEKSLPALPPNEIPKGAFSNDKVDPDSDTPTEISPRPRQGHRSTTSASRDSSRPARSPERSGKTDGLGLSGNSYRSNRSSTLTGSDSTEKDDGFFIPVALDPSPGPTPNSINNDGTKRKDYFNLPKSSFADKRNDSPSSTPHIAFQDKGRQQSTDRDLTSAQTPTSKLSQPSTSRSDQHSSPPSEDRQQRPPMRSHTNTDDGKGQTPKGRKAATSTSSSSSSIHDGGVNVKANNATSQPEVRKNGEAGLPPSRFSQDTRKPEPDDRRGSGDSNLKSGSRPENGKPVTRKDSTPPSARNTAPTTKAGPQRRESGNEDIPPPRVPPPRLKAVDQSSSRTEYASPRGPPPSLAGKPAPGSRDEQGSPKPSPKLPRWSNGGDFTMDEDMARILGTDEPSSNILRRASNVARHGRTNSIDSNQTPTRGTHTRSISETTRGTASPQWPKAPLHEDREWASPDLMSPVSVSSPDDTTILRRQLRTSEQRVAELEKQFNTEKDLQSLDRKLLEKRKTVSVLDTQTEIMIRQLEVLAGYVERAKDSKKPIDPRELEDSAIKDFVQKLEEVKMVLAESIEQLHEERDRLAEERDQASADRDHALMEFEQLSSKNAQLAEMNNDMTHQLQEKFRNQVADGKSSNGLGIYGENKAATASSINLDNASMTTGHTLVGDDDQIVENGPIAVPIRKGQVKKFNWKKGSKGLAQNVAKGVRGAVVAFQNDRGERIQQVGIGPMGAGDIGVPYNNTMVPPEPSTTPAPMMPQQGRQPKHPQQGFGFFSKKASVVPKSASANSMPLAVTPEAPSTLFGSDLSERADWERRQIPSVVTRCIEEVELRGVDQEGIYRKTGGNSQVNMIKDGFERSENFDISDPDWDITAVTSVLKQYFRKLPIPLLTFEVYDRILESTSIVDPSERCDHLRRTIASMPEKHRDCLEFLMFHLDRVAQRQSENLMTPKNLAVVFAPTIMFDRSIEREMTDMHSKNLAVQFIIENSRNIFVD
ncbi:unnamed protein product [Clonostachys solani]|uniref:Uncharacterized protein n=1 Tax=Clonostachys solani TaxID=160281 RepID=A0A9N9Z3Y2_9HYPO|nr:unnamed protein product [Clonostachys solani]